MQADDIKALSDVRLGHALECLDTAQKVMWDSAIINALQTDRTMLFFTL